LEDRRRDGSGWSSISLLVYYGVIVAAAAWLLGTQNPSNTELALLAFVGVLAGALPMERHAGRMRLRHVAWQATHDPLTRLHNRGHFMTQLSKDLRKRRWRQSLAVLLLDLDRFKTINDTLGHPAGDQLLEEVAARLSEMVSTTCTVARLGGDEFGIITVVSDKTELQKFGNSVVEALNFRTMVAGQPVWVNGSVGGAVASIPRPTLAELLSQADVALYQAKGGGRNQMRVYDPNERVPTVNELSMDYELKLAVQKEQLLVFYQPVMSLETEKIEGFEALVRWDHPYFGTVSPDRFIPMAEQNGMIHEIGRWVVNEACHQLAELHRLMGDHLSMSINLSALQISHSNVSFEVQAALEAADVDPEKVMLEMTETAFGSDETATLEGILELRRLGTKLAIDDFGVGYSSLNYLRRFPADYLKIDRSFVAEVTDARTYGVIKAAIDVGHVLGMQVIAEGVEMTDQVRLLTRAGCDFAQGFLFHKPMTAQQATQALIDEMYRISGEPAPIEVRELGFAA
jgi:diguanylate cyclase (GGDEF)-like protein